MLQQVHDFELALLEPCLAMSHRGVLIDNPLRWRRIKELGVEVTKLTELVREAVMPLLKPGIPREKLFREKWCCPCCRGGKKKSQACWSCEGFEKSPTKKQLGLRELNLCKVCNGEGKRETWVFNLASNDQNPAQLTEHVSRRQPEVAILFVAT